MRFPPRGRAAGGTWAIAELAGPRLCDAVATVPGRGSLRSPRPWPLAFQTPRRALACPPVRRPTTRGSSQKEGGVGGACAAHSALGVCIADAGIGFGSGPHGTAASPRQIDTPGDVPLPDTCARAMSTATS